jgi:hypothetical protein
MLIICLSISLGEWMGKIKVIFWRLCIPLLIWGSLAGIILLLPPVPQEPENLSPETWSYYENGAPLARQVMKYRTEILIVIVLCAVVTEIVFFIIEKKKNERVG